MKGMDPELRQFGIAASAVMLGVKQDSPREVVIRVVTWNNVPINSI